MENGVSRHPIERIWREVGLPEYFLGNDGSNHKLYALYDAIHFAISSSGSALTDALSPFAKAADEIEAVYGKDLPDNQIQFPELTMGDFRRARVVHESAENNLLEVLQWVRKNYASGPTAEINARIDAAISKATA